MNSFGSAFRIQIFGASHEPMVGIIIDGCPPGIRLNSAEFEEMLGRRRAGAKGTTPRKETDQPVFLSGVFKEFTTGAPLVISFENQSIRSADYEGVAAFPRPGHADFVSHHKYKGFEDYRGGGHFSGRLTVCLVAAGVVAKKIINSAITLKARIAEVGGETDVPAGLQRAIEAKDSVGGVVECCISGLPIGVGAPFFDSLESVIAHLAFSIPAIKGIEFGLGFAGTSLFGSSHNDAILNEQGVTKTNHNGGINGGLSNGNDVVFRVAVKPTSSTPQSQVSWNRETNQLEPLAVRGRHDLCIALRVPVILEAIAAIAVCDLMMRDNLITP